MTIYQVGEGGDFRTLSAAAVGVKPGDTVRIRAGIYRTALDCDVENVTWQGEPGAIIDGGWDGKTDTKTFEAVIQAAAEGVIVDGLTVRNSPGRGIGVGASRVTVRNCLITNCYKGGLGANPPAGQSYSGLLVENNVIRDVGLERLVTGEGRVNGSLLFTDVHDSVIRGNTVIGGLGEGMNVDRGSRDNLFEGNTIVDCAHVGIYVNCAQDNHIRGNAVIHTGAAKPVGKTDEAPAGIIIGDEHGGRQTWPGSSGNVIEGNVIVGCGKLLQVRNNNSNYSTTLDADTVILNNTFVAGPKTTRGIDIAENVQGKPHGPALFIDNAIEFSGAAHGAVIAARVAAALVFHHNGWSERPTAGALGDGDVVGRLMLTDPHAPVAGVADFDADNYRPLPGSPLIGAASDGATIGALDAAGAEPPDEPDEPPVEPPEPPDDGRDTAKLIEELQTVLAQLATAGFAINDAAASVDTVIGALKAAQ